MTIQDILQLPWKEQLDMFNDKAYMYADYIIKIRKERVVLKENNVVVKVIYGDEAKTIISKLLLL